jgi:hypothetical protein
MMTNDRIADHHGVILVMACRIMRHAQPGTERLAARIPGRASLLPLPGGVWMDGYRAAP